MKEKVTLQLSQNEVKVLSSSLNVYINMFEKNIPVDCVLWKSLANLNRLLSQVGQVEQFARVEMDLLRALEGMNKFAHFQAGDLISDGEVLAEIRNDENGTLYPAYVRKAESWDSEVAIIIDFKIYE